WPKWFRYIGVIVAKGYRLVLFHLFLLLVFRVLLGRPVIYGRWKRFRDGRHRYKWKRLVSTSFESMPCACLGRHGAICFIDYWPPAVPPRLPTASGPS